MNQALYLFSLGVFWLTPPVVLGWKFFHTKPIPWWLVFLTICVVCWLSINAAVHFAHANLDDLEASSPHDPILQDWKNSDGAANAFAFLFGWLFGLICSLPWLAVYGIFFRACKHKKTVEA